MLFNYSALSCTKQLSSTTRVVYANIRILLVWIVAIVLKWERFFWLKLIGFLFLIIGTLIYNDVISFKQRRTSPGLEEINSLYDNKVF